MRPMIQSRVSEGKCNGKHTPSFVAFHCISLTHSQLTHAHSSFVADLNARRLPFFFPTVPLCMMIVSLS